jgi:hypothetical protein
MMLGAEIFQAAWLEQKRKTREREKERERGEERERKHPKSKPITGLPTLKRFFFP